VSSPNIEDERFVLVVFEGVVFVASEGSESKREDLARLFGLDVEGGSSPKRDIVDGGS